MTDGQVRWYDPISHLARHCEGIQINGLLRYFDTNFYFRQPVVSGRIRRREPVLRREFEVARAATDRVVKPVMTGPYSLACGSILEGGYRTRRELAHAYAEVLAQEVADLVHAGAAVIQVDEPYLLRHPEDADLVREGIATLAAARGRAHLALYTFFGDALPLWDDLMAMPVDLVGLDLTYGPKLADRIAEAGAPRTLVLGVIDGRNTKLESRDALLRILDRVLPALPGAGGPRPVLRARAPAESPGPGEAREHGRDRARARGTRREAPMSRAKLRAVSAWTCRSCPPPPSAASRSPTTWWRPGPRPRATPSRGPSSTAWSARRRSSGCAPRRSSASTSWWTASSTAGTWSRTSPRRCPGSPGAAWCARTETATTTSR